jgi:DNA polymerase III subunit alpha
VYESEAYLRELIDTAKEVEGVVRNAGTHAAGVIITDKPVIEYIPLHRPTGSSAEESPIKIVSQFEMSVVGALGLLKVDFLGLSTLTIMARACDLIRERHGKIFTLANIPVEDPATYELLGRGDTAGVFQVEGTGMTRWLVQMKPKELANVIAMVALFRPGPMDFIPGYIKRMHGEEQVEYRHPALEPIFCETYGYPVYQEQLMFAAVKLAGYTQSESDDLRKAIAKKIKDKLEKHRQKFVEGAVKNGIERETAKGIFEDWEEFARYGFNKAHAADYGVIAVQTAYLKTHYPVEYMTALLSVSKNVIEKVALYAADCRRMGIAVEPPDINKSSYDFSIEDHENGKSAIRFGMGAVKNVGQGPVDVILQAREAGGVFKDLNDFARRVDLRHVGKRALESLIRVGALDSYGARPALLASLDRMLSVSATHFKAVDQGQMSMFGLQTGMVDEIVLPKIGSEISAREILNWERELIGLYVSDHPLNPVMDVLSQAVTHFSGQLGEAMPNERVRVAGIVTRVRPHQTKTGKAMGFVTMEDLQGNIELVVFPKTWEFSSIGVVDEELPEPDDPSRIETEETQLTHGAFSGSQAAAIENDWDEDMPPPPEAFPDDWGFPDPEIISVTAAPADIPVEGPQAAIPLTNPVGAPVDVPASRIEAQATEPSNPPPIIPDRDSPVKSIDSPQGISYILPPEPVTDGSTVHMITVVLRSTGDKTRDVLRVRRIHGLALSYPGNDRFALKVYERNRGYLVEFPNLTTRFCPELVSTLQLLVGQENVQIEPITFQ